MSCMGGAPQKSSREAAGTLDAGNGMADEPECLESMEYINTGHRGVLSVMQHLLMIVF